MKAIVDANYTRKDFVAKRIIEMAKCSKNRSSEQLCIGIYRLVMKAGADNFRQSSILDVMMRLKEHDAEVVIYEPNFPGEYFEGSKVLQDLEAFKEMSCVIVANRYNAELESVKEKVYTRDIYFRD